MPYIPDLAPVSGSHTPAAPSTSAATAPASGLAALGQGISNAGDEMAAVQQHMQEVRDNGVRNKARLLMQQATTENQRFRQDHPDESLWEADMQQRISRVEEEISQEKQSPFLRAELATDFKGWKQSSSTGVRQEAGRSTLQRARQSTMDTIRAYEDQGDYQSSRKLREQSRGKEFSAEEMDADQQDADERETIHLEDQSIKKEQARIAEDPDYGINTYRNPKNAKETGFLSLALIRKGQQHMLTQHDVMKGVISGEVATEEKLEHLTKDALPSVQANLRSELWARTNSLEQKRRATPEYQAETSGWIATQLLNFDLENVEARVAISAAIATLPEGLSKEGYSLRFSNAIEGKAGSGDEDLDESFTLMMQTFKTEALDGLPRPQTIGSLIATGVLQDKKDLWNLGLGSTEDKNSPAYKIAHAATNTERRHLFADLWKDPGKVKDGTPAHLVRFAHSLRDGQPDDHVVKPVDPSLQDNTLDIIGRVSMGIMKWRKNNRTADSGAIRAEMLRLAGPDAADQYANTHFGSQGEKQHERQPAATR